MLFKEEHSTKAKYLIFVTEEGIVICVNSLQLLNIDGKIVVISLESVITLHLLKTLVPNSTLGERIEICVNDEQSENAKLSILVTEEGIAICVNDEQPQKAYSPISVTYEGIVICANDEQPQKAYSPISVTCEGIVICFNDEQ